MSTKDVKSQRIVDSRHRIPELDGFRAVAILLVIGCHYQAFAALLHGLPEFGWVGVDIFFVLSGFLITSILLPLKNTPSPYIPFLRRRAVRIMPPYFLVLLVIATVCWAANPAQIRGLSSTLLRHVFFLSAMSGNLMYLSHAWGVIGGSAHPAPLFTYSQLPLGLSGFTASNFKDATGPFWSVSVEEWYYVLWAPVVLLLSRRAVAITAGFLIAFALCVRWFGFTDWHWYLMFLCRCDMLAFGGMLALWIEWRSSITHTAQVIGDRMLQGVSAIAVGCLALLLFYLRPFVGHEVRGSVAFAVLGPLLIAIIVAGAIATLLNTSWENSLLRKILRLTPTVYIGRRSYMLYLVHVPVYGAVYLALPLLTGIPSTSARLWVIAVASTGLSFGIAVASWRFFESPILSFRDKRRDRVVVLANSAQQPTD